VNQQQQNESHAWRRLCYFQKEKIAKSNVDLLLRIWLGAISIAAIAQVLQWPEEQTIICTLLAWCSCVMTGFAVFRYRVTLCFPWSSLMILMFCLQSCGLPLCLLLIQGNPIDEHLRVPVATFTHILLCHIVLIVTHLVYCRMRWAQGIGSGFWRRFLLGFGFFKKLTVWQILSLGGVGFLCTFYLTSVTRLEQGGQIAATGAVWERLVNGLTSFAFAPFLLLFPSQIITGGIRKRLKLFLIAYLLILFCVAAALNSRGFLFVGFAMALVFLILSLFTGSIRLKLSTLTIWSLLAVLSLSIASDLAVTLQLARNSRASKTSMELILDTVSLLTVGRDDLEKAKAETKSGADATIESWYVFDPTLSRLVTTHFLDRALAIGLNFDANTKTSLREAEYEKAIAVLPNPILKVCNLKIDKDYVMGCSMGDQMMVWGGDNGLIGGFGTGGFIGDGYAAFGWDYLFFYGLISFVLFLIADSFYQQIIPQKQNQFGSNSNFSPVGFMFGFTIVTVLFNDSMAGLIGFIIRQPLQWLFLFGLFLVCFKAVSLLTKPVTMPR